MTALLSSMVEYRDISTGAEVLCVVLRRDGREVACWPIEGELADGCEPEDEDALLAALAVVSGNLADYIATQAREIAEPRIAAHVAETTARILQIDTAHVHELDRVVAVKEELGRQLACQLRQVDSLMSEAQAWRAVSDLHQPYYTGPDEGRCRACTEAGLDVVSPCPTRAAGERARAAARERAKAQAANHG